MKCRRSLGIRGRVALQVTVPFLILMAFLGMAFQGERDAQLALARERVQKAAHVFGADQRRILESARQMLATTATLPVNPRAGFARACDAAMASSELAGSEVEHVMVANADGAMVCEAGIASGVTDIARLRLFHAAASSRAPVVGSDVAASGVTRLAMAVPLVEGDRLRAVLIAGVSDDTFRRAFEAAAWPESSSASVVLEDGTLLLRFPHPATWVGRRAPAVRSQSEGTVLEDEGNTVSRGPDGITRVYGYARVFGPAGEAAYVVLGIPRAEVIAPVERRLWTRGAVALALLLLLFAYIAIRSDRLFVRPILQLSALAGRLGRGELEARSDLHEATAEMQQLASALDNMAQSLQSERERLAHAHRTRDTLHACLDSLPAATAFIDCEGRILFANEACRAWVTQPERDLLGARVRDLLAPEIVSAVLPFVGKACHGQSQRFQLPAPGANGEQRHAEVFLLPEARGNGGFLLFVQDTTDHQAQYEAMAHLAQVDALTGLPNRRTFVYALESALVRAERQGTGVGVLFADLDQFKTINDTLGHHTGDLVLCAFARELVGAVRQTDVVGRLGGDEFAVLLEGVDDEVVLADVVAHIGAALAGPRRLDGHDVTLRASIGAVYGAPGAHATAEAVLAAADGEMYRAKRAKASVDLACEAEEGATA